ncbi:ribosome-associated protein [Breznakibacter xylanolyticus]|uniref:Ribosomal silencing factor RsfS n=1 Tax=Breznakibacter xylanolyticus TaxID=990 RepID=A0A2W7MVF6_9BACT|nr:ribosome silencing factor [Breznakibacter xylanolyticus]MBN2742683.1 ribosome silencing factor [Marinilabiliaceae bacterium]PZX11810.1 ribosome-associated protein [Breznakibacter xylanolyticus]
MTEEQAHTGAEQLANAVVLGLQEKKGTNIVMLDLHELENSVCQYFVICDGDSNTHVSAIADACEDYVWEQINDKPLHTEGHDTAQWVLIDYGDVVVHVFQRPVRAYYNLEELWADARRTDIANLF